MTSRQDSDEIFEMAGSDASSWLHQARLLKTSAKLSQDEIERVRHSSLTGVNRSEALMAHIQSYMLLTSFSFENLIKGILIGRMPNMVSRQRLNTALWNNKDGHKIVDIIPSDIPLSEQEKDLLIRLQTYAIWAGRYPIPMKSHDYHSSHGYLTYRTTDPVLVDSLFLRLVKSVIHND